MNSLLSHHFYHVEFRFSTTFIIENQRYKKITVQLSVEGKEEVKKLL